MDEQTALALVQEDYSGEEYESVEEWVDAGHHKHDTTNYYSIFRCKSDNTHWRVNFQSSYNEGLDTYSIYAYQVEKVEVVKTQWVPVTNTTQKD
jgi:hypothetical protein